MFSDEFVSQGCGRCLGGTQRSTDLLEGLRDMIQQAVCKSTPVLKKSLAYNSPLSDVQSFTFAMRLTATLLAVFTLLSTGALVQAVSHDAQACAKLTDCGSCVNASRCGYSVDTQSCIAKKGHSGTIVISAPQCKKVSSILAARSLTLAIRAEIYDTRVGPHTVNGTPNKPKSGRHLTSTWFAEPKNATTLAHININPDPSSDL